MTSHQEGANQLLGSLVGNWSGALPPQKTVLTGQHCRLEPFDLDAHGKDLYNAWQLDAAGSLWTYLPYGPFDSRDAYLEWAAENCCGDNPLFYAIVDQVTHKAIGVASYLRINPAHGSVEVGHLCFSPLLQQTLAATEAMFLMMQQAFALGYRRYEWKCNSLNRASRRAAQRLGFSYEGLFRQSHVFKERNRDTAWYSIIDREWPALQQVFHTWLAEDNFADGKQKQSLSQLTAPLLAQKDPVLENG